MRFDPAGYPGRPPEAPTLVHAGRTVELAVTGTSTAPVTPVPDAAVPGPAAVLAHGAVRWSLAYGANADPARLIDKGLDHRGAIVLPAAVLGHRRVWEARRTTSTGAVPLTLVAAPGIRLDVWLLGVHADDIGRLDASEGRGRDYVLGRVGPVAVADRFCVPDALAYGPAADTAVVAVGARPAGYPELAQEHAGALADDVAATRLRADPLPRPHHGPWPRTPLQDLPLFVYGTLRPGERYWPRIADLVDVVGEGTCPGSVVDTRFGWPAAEPAPAGRFEGVLLRPRDPDAARRLFATTDRIEQAPTLFRRRAMPVTAAGHQQWAIVYVWAPGQGPPPPA